MNHKQLFIISGEAYQSLRTSEVDAIVADMKELNIYKLPYPSVNVRVPLDICRPTAICPEAIDKRMIVWDDEANDYRMHIGPGSWMDIEDIQLDHLELAKAYLTIDPGNGNFKPCRVPVTVHLERSASEKGALAMAKALIVLLATRNVVKSTKHNTLARHGFGAKRDSSRRYEYVTTLSTPTVMEADPEKPPKEHEVCAHLRRGHIRHQHFGPHNSYVKRIWIKPVFVNADKEWVSTRTAYNLGVSL